jgi:signal peptidase I
MHFDFPTLLVFLTFFTGGVWLLDALLFAPRRRLAPAGEATAGDPPAPPAEPLLVEYSRSFFPVILIVLLLRSFLLEPFRIPSGSMMPTLLVGDFILVNKFVYGLRLPVLNRKFVELGTPERGDVVVFRYPLDTKVDYIKRVVAVPGDILEYRRKTLYVNGEPQAQTPIGQYTGVGAGSSMNGAIEGIERLGEVEHRVLVRPQAHDFPPGCQVLMRGPVQIPEGHFFVMGDNRDNSNDSRCWGLVPETNLVGKAFAIWMSWDSERDGFPIDWGRLGNSID